VQVLFNLRTQDESLHTADNNNGVRVVNFSMNKCTLLTYYSVHKYTWNSANIYADWSCLEWNQTILTHTLYRQFLRRADCYGHFMV